MITFLGDSHGHFNTIHTLIKRHKNPVVHVGDVGIGFGEKPQSFPDNFFFIHGNHDNPDECKKYSNFLGRYGYNEHLNLFFVSGAWSIDRQWRTLGVDLFYNEELSAAESNAALELYEKIRPRFLVTHDGPSCAIEGLVNPFWGGIIPTSTGRLLDEMFKIHKPELWIFGHHHLHLDKIIENVRFICLNIDQEITLDLKNT